MIDPQEIPKPEPEQDDSLPLDDAIDSIAGHFQVPRGVYTRMVQQESGGNDRAESPKGAYGRFQVMPDTLQGIAKETGKQLDNANPLHNAYAGLKLLSDNYKRFKPKAQSDRHAWMMAVAGYHGNPDNVDRDLEAGGIGIPDQGDGGINTRDHVYNIFKDTTDDDFKLSNVTTGNQKPSEVAGAQLPITEPQPQPAQVAPENEEVESFTTKTDSKKPIRETGIQFTESDGRNLNLAARASIGAAQLDQGTPSAADPDIVGAEQQIRVRPQGKNLTADELNDAVLASYGDDAVQAGRNYRTETKGRNIAVSADALASLMERGTVDPKTGEMVIPVQPKKSFVRILNAYMEGGLEAATEANLDMQRKRDELDAKAAAKKAEPRTLMGEVDTGIRRGMAANAKLVGNAAELAEGVYKEIRHGRESEEFKDYERDKEENAAISSAALESMPEGDGVAGKVAQGISSVLPQLPVIAATGLTAQPALGALQALDQGNVAALKQGVISGASVGGAKAAGHLAKELSPVVSNLTQRAAGGATNVAGLAAMGERDPSQLTADFLQGAAMPVGNSRRVMHERLGELTITGTRNDGRLDAVDADGATHAIQNPRKGNQRATFINEVKQESADGATPQQDSATPVEQTTRVERAPPESLVGRQFRNNETGRLITITKENEKGVTVSYEVDGRTQRVGITKGFLAGKFTEQPSGGISKDEAVSSPVKAQEDSAADIAPAQKPKHDYSSTQVDLPKDVSSKVIAASKQISDNDLANVGWNAREDSPHITVKFGLHGDNADAVRAVLADEPSFKVKLGKTSIFAAKEGADYDVVKVDVDSPELHRLNRKLSSALPATDTHPTYQPHVTLAYVKTGKGKEYADRSDLEGQEITFDRIAFSGKTGEKVEIPLEGVKQTTSLANNIPANSIPADVAPTRSGSLTNAQSVEVSAKVDPTSVKTEGGKVRTRSFPKTLEDAGLPGGTNRKHTPITNAESMRRAAETIKTKGVDGAIDYIKQTDKLTAEHTATGISLIGRLQREADTVKATRPEEAEGKYARAVEVASELSRKLTESGQAIQAASIVSRLSPDGITLFAQRQIAKQSPDARVSPGLAQTLVAAAKKVTTIDAVSERAVRIAAIASKAKAEGKLEAHERAEIREYVKELQGLVGDKEKKPRGVAQMLTARLDTIEIDAHKRLQARGYRLNSGIPVDDVADFATIYAARLAKGSVKDVQEGSCDKRQ